MTDDDIKRIESETGVSLPECYREFLLKHSVTVRNLQGRATDYGVYPWIDADEIIRENSDFPPEYFGDDGESVVRNVVVIADNGAGGYYFLYRNSDPAGIWFLDSTIAEIEPIYEDFDEYLAELRE